MTIKFDSLPIIVPDGYTIQTCRTSGWGAREVRGNPNASGFHKGVDLAFAGCRDKPILAVAAGTVRAIINQPSGCGNGVAIRHREADNTDFEFETIYCHMSERPLVSAGQTVTAGQQIGKIGDTGNPRPGADHLHFMLKTERVAPFEHVDPWPFLINSGRSIPLVVSSTPSTPIPSSPTGTPPARSGVVSSRIAGLESFHPHIQYELTRRRSSSEMVNSYMPYVKLTSLVKVYGKNLAGEPDESLDAYCPTLGVHGQQEMFYDDIYSISNNNRSIVAHATIIKNGTPISVPVLVEKNTPDPSNIPPPGITGITTERNTAGAMGVRGGLFRATVKISAYSIGQLNALLKYFLRPATRVVLEYGRTSSSEFENKLTDVTAASAGRGDSAELFKKFNWKRSLPEIDNELEAIVRQLDPRNIKQQQFTEKYIWNNFGQYEIFIGYVVNFKYRYTKANVYEIELQIHSVQQFEIPVKITSGKSLCTGSAIPNSEKVLDIEDYFAPMSGYKHNSFSKVLANAVAGVQMGGVDWRNDIIQLQGAGADNNQAGSDNPGYLVSWQFFIDVILNDEEYGLMSIFSLNTDANSQSTLNYLRTALPKPIKTLSTDEATDESMLKAYEVSYHKELRSTDISTMIIHNPNATRNQNIVETLTNLGIVDEELVTALGNSAVSDEIEAKSGIIGSFTSFGDTASLRNGIWLNTNAIAQSFVNADTISAALDSLVQKMNNATQGFWNIQVLSNDTDNPGIHIIDMGLSKKNDKPVLNPSDISVTNTINNFAEDLNKFRTPGTNIPKYIYMFNRKLVRGDNDDIGGDILDITLESSLPQVVAVQAIAGVGGVAQRSTLQAINIDELKNITLYNIYPTCASQPTPPSDTPQDASTTPASGYSVLTQDQINKIKDDLRANQGELSSETRAEIFGQTRPPLTFWGSIFGGDITRGSEQQTKVEDDLKRVRDEFSNQISQQNSSYISLVKEYAGAFGSAIDYIAYDKTSMMKLVDENSEDAEVHPFNSSNLTKTTVDLTLPGIGGIQLFEAFAVDRVPDILDRGYYIVTKIAHEFSLQNGWITKLTGRFRFKKQGLRRE